MMKQISGQKIKPLESFNPKRIGIYEIINLDHVINLHIIYTIIQKNLCVMITFRLACIIKKLSCVTLQPIIYMHSILTEIKNSAEIILHKSGWNYYNNNNE